MASRGKSNPSQEDIANRLGPVFQGEDHIGKCAAIKQGSIVFAQKAITGQLRRDLEDQVSNSQQICSHQGSGRVKEERYQGK